MVMQTEGEVLPLVHGDGLPPDFSSFFAKEHRGLYRALFFVTGNRADAAELMQEAFLRLWERWDTIDRIEDPTAYLFRVALNGWRMRVRAARRAAARLAALAPPPDQFDEANLREDVRKMLLRLSPRQRAALILLDMYGYSSKEAAHIMRIRPSTVRALATQGRTALRTLGGSDA